MRADELKMQNSRVYELTDCEVHKSRAYEQGDSQKLWKRAEDSQKSCVRAER